MSWSATASRSSGRDAADCSVVDAPAPAGDNEPVAGFGGSEPFTTWDGEPVARDRPHGAMIVVASRAPEGWRYVLLHRAHRGPAWDGDWAWTPPSGSRKPGEDVTACAIRELQEETGLRGSPRPVIARDVGWAVFAHEIPWGTVVMADGTEHDRFEWVTYAEACRRCRPAELVSSFAAACQASGFS
jgi:8-oxo-dGTP pyrophosphatase MutT (NUDIX family)